MATLETHDANILDADTISLRWIVYPLLAVLALVVGGFVFYYYQQGQRDQLEDQARLALINAATPEELIAVAAKYPTTDQATLATLSAADMSFAKRDYDSAIKAYKTVLNAPTAILAQSAGLGLASSQEAAGKLDEAISAYLTEARRGKVSPYTPFAFISAARIYEQKGDKENEKKILTEAIASGIDSPFVKQAQAKLQELNAPPPMKIPVPAAPAPAATTPAANAAPVAPAPPAAAPVKK